MCLISTTHASTCMICRRRRARSTNHRRSSSRAISRSMTCTLFTTGSTATPRPKRLLFSCTAGQEQGASQTTRASLTPNAGAWCSLISAAVAHQRPRAAKVSFLGFVYRSLVQVSFGLFNRCKCLFYKRDACDLRRSLLEVSFKNLSLLI